MGSKKKKKSEKQKLILEHRQKFDEDYKNQSGYFSPDIQREYKEKYISLLKDIRNEFPAFQIINKKYSKFNQMIGKIAAIFNSEYNTKYTTTIGPVIYVNSGKMGKNGEIIEYSWYHRPYKERYETMLHERIHMRQEQRFGLTTWYFVYEFVPFPMLLAYFRKKWEAEAYRIGIFLKLRNLGREYVLGDYFLNYILDQFCGPFYMFTWYSKRDIKIWLLKTVRAIEKGELTFSKLVNNRKVGKNKKGLRKLKVPWLIRFLYPEEFKNDRTFIDI